MKFFSRLFSRRSGIANPQKWLIDYFTGGTKSAAGINVTPDTALQASAVYACFPAGALVKTSEGCLKKIEDVVPSDSITTHAGTPSDVTEKIVREYTGNLITIKRWGGGKIDVTAEHPFYVFKKPSYSKWYRGADRNNNIVYEWVKAGDLKKGDYLVEPIQGDIVNCDLFPVFTKTRAGGKGSKPHYEFKEEQIQINAESMRLIGYFLAEGFVNGRSVKFAFSEEEIEYHGDLKNLMLQAFGVEAKIYPYLANGKSIVFAFHSVKAVEFFSQFGKTAKNKYIPQWIMFLPFDLQKQLLKGYWRGDGCQTVDGFNIDTASCQLAEDIKMISLRLGMIPSKIKRMETVVLPMPESRVCRESFNRIIYKLCYRGKNAKILSEILCVETQTAANRSYTFIANGYAHYPIRDISSSAVENLLVYNLEVAGEQSYICEGVAVHNCVRVLAETIASLPLHVYRRLEGGKGKEKAPEHYLYPVLHEIANPEMTSFELRETMVGHLCLRGNAYAEKVFDRAGRVKELWPLNPDGVLVERDKATKQLIYIITLPGESKQVKLSSDRILHIRGLSGNGIIGYSPIALAKESIGLALATEEYGSRFFGNGSRPAGTLEHPGKLGKDAADRLKKSWEEMHRGLSNAHRVAILEEGLKWNQIGMSQEDAQYLQTRQFQVVDIARIFRVPPHMIAELTRATYSNIEQQSIDFVVNTIRPWLVRFEQAFKQRLFDATDREYYAEFLIDGLLRGDIASRYSAYAVGRQWGWLSADDIREMENRNPLPGGQGETYLVPLNMIPADKTARIGDIAKELPKNDNKEQKAREMFTPIMKDVGMRIVRRERADIMRQLKKSKDIEGFKEWLDGFYIEHAEFIRKAISPVAESYYPGYDDVKRRAMEVELYTLRHINNSKNRIIKLTDYRNYDTTTLEKALAGVFDTLEAEVIGGKIN